MEINDFLKQYGKKLRGREWYYAVDNNQCSPKEWDTAKLRILVVFFSSGPTRSVSSTFNALNNIIRTETPEYFVDCAYLPLNEDLELFDNNNVPYFFGNVSHKHPKEYDVIFFSHSIIAERFNFPLFYKTTGIPYDHHERMADPTVPLIQLGGVASTYGESIYGKFTVNGKECESLTDVTYLGSYEEKGSKVMKVYEEIVKNGNGTKMDYIKAVCTTFNMMYYPLGYEVKYDGDRIISNTVKYDWVRPFVTIFTPEDMSGPNLERKIINLEGTSAGDGEIQVSHGALAGGTYIRTSNGLRRIEDLYKLEPNCKIHTNFTSDTLGGEKEISTFYNQGTQETLRITTEFGRVLELTPEHRIHKFTGLELDWIEPKDLKVGDLLPIKLGSSVFGREGTFEEGLNLGLDLDIFNFDYNVYSSLSKEAIIGFLHGVYRVFGRYQPNMGVLINQEEVLEFLQYLFTSIGVATLRQEGMLQILDEYQDLFLSLEKDPSGMYEPEVDSDAIVMIEESESNVYDLTEPDTEQFIANDFSVHNCSGYSSCHFSVAQGTRVYTKDGLIRIENLVGQTPDVLASRMDKAVSVKEVATDSVCRVKYNDGLELEASKNHIFLTLNKQTGELEEKLTTDLVRGDIALKAIDFSYYGDKKTVFGLELNEALAEYCGHTYRNLVTSSDNQLPFNIEMTVDYLFSSPKSVVLSFLSGVFYNYSKFTNTCEIFFRNRKHLLQIQQLLSYVGISAKSMHRKSGNAYALSIVGYYFRKFKSLLDNVEFTEETDNYIPNSDFLRNLVISKSCFIPDGYESNLDMVPGSILDNFDDEELTEFYKCVKSGKFKSISVFKVDYLDIRKRMFDIETRDTHWCVYGGVLTHNCTSGDTIIETESGYSRIEDLVDKGSMKVMDRAGLVNAKNVIFNGTKRLYRVNLERGYSIRLTEDHKVPVYLGSKEKFVQVKDLHVGDKVILKKGTSERFMYEDERHGFSWLVGYMLGAIHSGTATISKTGSITLKVDESENRILHRLAILLNSLNLIKSEASLASSAGLSTEYEIKKTLRNKLKEYTDLHSSFPECMSTNLLNLSREEFLAFYLGLLDSPVSGKGYCTRLNGKSQEFLRDLQVMLLKYGISSYIRVAKKGATSQDSEYTFSCDNSYFDVFHKYSLIKNHKNVDLKDGVKFGSHNKDYKQNNLFVLKVAKKELSTIEKVYDVFDTDTHTFIANNILISNCAEGNVVGPWRELDREELNEKFHALRKYGAVNAISFYSFNSNFTSYFKDALSDAAKVFQSTSLIAMRADEMGTEKDTLDFAKLFGLKRITFAVEGFGHRIRNVFLNKNLPFEKLFEAAKVAFENKMIELKFCYILTGHETEEDWEDGINEIKKIDAMRRNMGANTSIRCNITPLVHYSHTPLRKYERRMAKASLTGSKNLTVFIEAMREIGVRTKMNGRGYGTFMEQMTLDGGRRFTQTVVDYSEKFDYIWCGNWGMTKYKEFVKHVCDNYDIDYLLAEKDDNWIDNNHRLHHAMYGGMLLSEYNLKKGQTDIYCVKTHAQNKTTCQFNAMRNNAVIIPSTQLLSQVSEVKDADKEVYIKQLEEIKDQIVKFNPKYPDFLDKLGIEPDPVGIGSSMYDFDTDSIRYTGCSHCATKENKLKRINRSLDIETTIDEIRESIALNSIKQTIRFKIFKKPEWSFVSFSSLARMVVSRMFMNSPIDLEPSFHSITHHHTNYWYGANGVKDWSYGVQYFDVNFKTKVDLAQLKALIPEFNKHIISAKIEDMYETLDREDKIKNTDLGFCVFRSDIPYHTFQSKIQNWNKTSIKVPVKSMQDLMIEIKSDRDLVTPLIIPHGTGTIGAISLKLFYSPWLYLATILDCSLNKVLETTDIANILYGYESSVMDNVTHQNQLIDRFNSKYLPLGVESFMKKSLSYGKNLFK